MKTDDLVALLARQAGPAPRGVVARRFLPVALLGFVLSAWLARQLGSMIPPELLSDAGWWTKFVYVALLALTAGLCLARLARPAASPRGTGLGLALVLAAMLLLGLFDWLQAAPDERMARMMGHSWSSCPLNVLVLSLPAMAGAFWALRGLAPTRPVWAGAAAGLFAGALGAMGYALICTEVAESFVAVWYTLGVAAATLLGASLGSRLLRW